MAAKEKAALNKKKGDHFENKSTPHPDYHVLATHPRGGSKKKGGFVMIQCELEMKLGQKRNFSQNIITSTTTVLYIW